MDCKKGKPSARSGLWHCIFWKLESLERNVLRSFQIGPLEAWENVIQRGTTCLWEHLKYGVWVLSYNIFHRNCFLISQIGKPLYIIYLPLPSSDWNDQGELFFDQHFFSKHFPMEKSMKNENFDFSREKKHPARIYSNTRVSNLGGGSSAHPSLEWLTYM